MNDMPDHWIGSDLVRREDWIPIFNVRAVDHRFVLTNRMGDWDVLDSAEFNQLNQVLSPRELVKRLADSRLVIFEDNANTLLPQWRSFNNGIDRAGPRLHIVHLTQRCNLGCSYCHSAAIPVTAKGRDITTENAISTARFIASTPSPNITVNFQGGEPTLMGEMISVIMDELLSFKEKRIRASITTNGTLLTPEIKAILQKYSISVTVSLDGPKNVNDSVRTFRDGSGSYDAAITGRTAVVEAGLRLSGSILVLTKNSAPHVKSVIDEYVALGQKSIHLKPATKLGFGKSNWADVGLTFEEYWDCYRSAIEYMLSLQKKGTTIIELQMKFALQLLIERTKSGYVDFRNPCGLVYGVLNYDIDGRIYGCHEGKRKKDFLIGHVRESSNQVLLSERSNQLASSSVLDKHPECRACAYLPYCSPCPANTHQMTGVTEIKPYEDFHCKFTLKLFDWLFEKLESDPDPIMGWWRYDALRRALKHGGTFASKGAEQGAQADGPASGGAAA